MKILVAGATGAVGRRLIPLLTAAGHDVIGTTTNSGKVDWLSKAGAKGIVLDLLNRDSVVEAIDSMRPDVIVNQATGLARMKSLKDFDREFALTNRLRVEGTQNLLAGALAAGIGRIIVQSYTGWPNERTGSRIKTELDHLDPSPPKSMSETLDALQRMEKLVLTTSSIEGIALRYGSFYGPGTAIAPRGDIVEAVRQRKFPIVGTGGGVWSWIHLDDLANATRAAIEHGPAGIYNIVDDEPSEVSIWLPYLAELIGAKRPMKVPVWVGRLFVGDAGVSMMTMIRGSSNAKAKRMLNWQPRFKSWREGFRSVLGS